MTAEQLNAFLRLVSREPALQRKLTQCGAASAAALAKAAGYDVEVANLTRYKARATSWRLSDEELEVVAAWQPKEQPYWWQHIWPRDE